MFSVHFKRFGSTSGDPVSQGKSYPEGRGGFCIKAVKTFSKDVTVNKFPPKKIIIITTWKNEGSN